MEINYFAIAIFIIFFFSIVWVMFYERKINQLLRKRDQDVENQKRRNAPMFAINGTIDRIRADAQIEIDKLERKRRFILEKLPFIKR